MKNPGPIRPLDKIHVAMMNYARVVAKEFEMAEPAVMGQLLKLHTKMGEAAESPEGMINLIIDCSPCETVTKTTNGESQGD